MNTDRPRPLRIIIGAAAAAIAGSMLVAGCGSTATTAATAPTTAPTAAPTTAATSAGTAAQATTTKATTAGATAGPQTYDVRAADYQFEGVPAQLAVGSELKLTNTSGKEVHELVVFRIPETETRTAADLAALPTGELMGIFRGPPALVIVAPPSAPGFNAVGDGKVTAPGRYLVMCSIPIGADPAAYLAAAKASKGGPVSVPGGAPHHSAGMVTELTAS